MKNKKNTVPGKNLNEYRGRSLGEETVHRLFKNPGAVIGMIYLCVLIVLVIAAGFIYDFDTKIVGLDPMCMFAKPSLQHPFGCDNLGRDILARILYGGRYSLVIGAGSVAIGIIFGIILGALAGFYGGAWDQFVMRLNDVLYSIPNIMVAVVIVSIIGRSVGALLISLSVTVVTWVSRTTRAAVMTVRGQEYIESAYAMGLPTWKIIFKHVLPNCLSPIIVQVTLMVGSNIISTSSLSFLGVGVSVPLPEWGTMLADGRTYIRSAPWMCIFPGLFIMLTVLALNLIGDGLRDALDPKLKK